MCYIGPYIHVEGFFHSPRVVRVVNTEPSDCKKDKDKKETSAQQRAKRGLHDAEHRARSTNMGHSSTLSKEYDHKNVDESWKCVFCHNGTWHKGLGDLFGPYWVKLEDDTIETNNFGSKSSRSGRRKRSEEDTSKEAVVEETEVWFHEDCLVWLPGVYVIGSRKDYLMINNEFVFAY